jgi:starch-binding outer membrane protein, SusD/RagB family
MRNRMTDRRLNSPIYMVIAVVLALGLSGCDDFFEVRNPNVIDAETVDAVQDGDIFARSAFQTLSQAYGVMIVYSGWFSNEAWVGDTFPTRNEYGRRTVASTNGTHTNDVWFPLARAVAQGEQVLDLLSGEPEQELNLARGALTSGFGLVLMAETFCEGTMAQPGNEPGPLMTPEELLETAVNRFDQVISEATAAGGTDAGNMANAARVGQGRALLQLGRTNEAVQAVQDVPGDFTFNTAHVDDPGARGRLGNPVHFFSAGGSREALVVPPHYREIGQDLTGDPASPSGDPRIQFFDAGRDAQDGTLRLWSQQKYPNWSAGVGLASGLEARYIEVEARNDPSEMRAFVNERRAVGGQGPYEGSDLLGQLMAQRSLDFWLSARRMGDWRRNGNAVPNILPPGDYYKDGIGGVGTDTCLPIPFNERQHNPNID